MGMQDNWKKYIHITKSKGELHMKVALYWDRIHSITSLLLIVLGAVTTFLSLMSSLPPYLISTTAGFTTLVSAVAAFMRPHDRRQMQLDAAKDFKILMFKMIRCETERDYEDLWRELNQVILNEPIVPKNYIKENLDMEWSVTPELQMVIAEKEEELHEALGGTKYENGNNVGENGYVTN